MPVNDSKTYYVANCPSCNEQPKLLSGSGGFAIACGNEKCDRRPRVTRPRASMVVKSWNDLAGVLRIRPAVSSEPEGFPLPTPRLPFGWRARLGWRIRRLGLRILWRLSRPGWRACEPCAGKFAVHGFTYACNQCGLPYADAEAERMVGGAK